MKNSFDITTFDSSFPYHIFVDKIEHFELHWHTYIEIFYTMKGSIRLNTGDHSFLLDEGHICFVNSGVIHSVDQTETENQILVLQISNTEHNFLNTLQDLKFNHESYLADLANHKLPLEELQKLLLHIYQEDLSRSPGYKHAILSFICALISIMIRNNYLIAKTKDDYIMDSNLNRLTTIIEYLDNHYMDKITLQDVASQVHMNYYYLSHFFKDTAGMSFQDYLNNLRLDKSLALLSDANSSITKVALESGFANIKAYTNAFRSKFGMLPSQYRKTVLQETLEKDLEQLSILQKYEDATQLLFGSSESVSEFLRMTAQLEKPDANKHTMIHSFDISFPHSPELLKNQVGSSLLLHHLNPIFCDLSDIDEIMKYLKFEKLYLDKNSFIIEDSSFFINDNSLCTAPLTSELSSQFKKMLTHKFPSITTELLCTKEDISCEPSLFPYEIELASYSLLHSCSLLYKYFKHPNHRLLPVFHQNQSTGVSTLFDQSNNLITRSNIPSPALFLLQYLSQLGEEVIHSGSNFIITRHNDEIRLLCYHEQSYRTFLQLEDTTQFDVAKYQFFVNSYPSMRLNFCFKDIKRKLKKLTYSCNSSSGSLLDNWLLVGSPTALNPDILLYLQKTTRPMITESIVPFSETPIVTVDLPPLGFAFVRLQQL